MAKRTSLEARADHAVKNEAEADHAVKTGTKTGGKVLQGPAMRMQKAYTVHQRKKRHRKETEAEAEAETGQRSQFNKIGTEIYNVEIDDTINMQVECNNVRHVEKATLAGVEIVCL